MLVFTFNHRFKYSVFTTGDVGEQGDKGSIGKAIDGPTGDQGHQGMWSYSEHFSHSMS